MSGTFHLSVVTPEREVLAVEARFVAFPAYDGEMGILPNRAALLTQLGSGELRVEEASGAKRTLFVSGGFAQMVDDKLTLLADEARDPASLTSELVEQAQATLGKALARTTGSQAEKQTRAEIRARAIARLVRFSQGD
jgi:F-type H+-transporting ATPase subunit epsilon